MNKNVFSKSSGWKLLFLVILCVLSLYGQEELRNHILCSNQKTRDVLVMDVNGDWSKPESILWKWNPEGDPNIPPESLKRFNHIDETKVVNNGKQILVTSSHGGMALVDVATKQSVFTGYPGGSPHSADLLPDGTIITASSAGNLSHTTPCASANVNVKVLYGALSPSRLEKSISLFPALEAVTIVPSGSRSAECGLPPG